MKEFNFSDDVIVYICKALQIAMITGTDIVDNLRMMKLVEGESGTLEATEEFKAQFESNIEKMMEEIEKSNNLDETPA
ncbi:MAG: hypothetical protein CMB77_04070 [Euryarchaeota archaeon]|nr:hypothetical protein [Euryarchaeota archaeon]|tara:strand:+ start:9849 stop:10082 length:234 start_codon:yes stop_codon:yes gene_type:complete